jgi:YidC/Oxa1 family membrane protein insertase
VCGGLVLIIAVVAELTRRFLRAPAPAEGTHADAATPRAAVAIAGVLPYLTAVFAIFVPLAASLYLAVTVTWTLAQRIVLRRRFPLG